MYYRRLLFLLLISSLILFSETIVVDTIGVEGDSLQIALDSTILLAGIDTILVRNGTYHLNINPNEYDSMFMGLLMRDSVVLVSENGALSCTLTGLSQDKLDTALHVIYCNSISNNSVIKGFTIKDGNAIDWEVGGGIHLYSSSPKIEDNKIINNSSSLDGGGVYMYYHSYPILINNQIENNSGHFFGAGITIIWSSPTLIGNSINNNHCDYYGGGMFISDSSSVYLRNNLIFGNTSLEGGGIFTLDESTVNLSRDIITMNVADSGGAFYNCHENNINLDSCTVIDNVSLNNKKSGFALFITDAGPGLSFNTNSCNLYHNSFQPDTEIVNNSSNNLLFENNYWWFTDSSEIDQIIDGPISFFPYSYNPFSSGIPSEPLFIDSVRNYRNNNYSEVADSIGTYDTLFISVYGEDANPDIREVALVILKSSRYPMGIAATLFETDSSSGVYRGYVKPFPRSNLDYLLYDDAYQNIGINIQDTVKITANMDTTRYFLVGFNAPISGIDWDNDENKYSFCIVRRITGDNLKISYKIPKEERVKIILYDAVGREIRVLRNTVDKGYKKFNYNINDVKSGVYFVKTTIGNYRKTVKILKVK